MLRSRVIVTIMLFVLILLLMTSLCSAKDNKSLDTKVTVFILMASEIFYYSETTKIKMVS